MKYICKQLQCKQKVPETERPEALDSYPHLRDWLRTINLRPELIQVRHLSHRRKIKTCPASTVDEAPSGDGESEAEEMF